MTGIGNKGNSNYIICTETGESCIFSPFGEYQGSTTSTLALIDLMNVYIEVDIVSIIGNSDTKSCDILCNGYRTMVNESYLNVFSTLKKEYASRRQNSIIYRINHDKEDVSQVILVFRKNTMSCKELGSLFNCKKEDWIKIY